MAYDPEDYDLGGEAHVSAKDYVPPKGRLVDRASRGSGLFGSDIGTTPGAFKYDISPQAMRGREGEEKVPLYGFTNKPIPSATGEPRTAFDKMMKGRGDRPETLFPGLNTFDMETDSLRDIKTSSQTPLAQAMIKAKQKAQEIDAATTKKKKVVKPTATAASAPQFDAKGNRVYTNADLAYIAKGRTSPNVQVDSPEEYLLRGIQQQGGLFDNEAQGRTLGYEGVGRTPGGGVMPGYSLPPGSAGVKPGADSIRPYSGAGFADMFRFLGDIMPLAMETRQARGQKHRHDMEMDTIMGDAERQKMMAEIGTIPAELQNLQARTNLTQKQAEGILTPEQQLQQAQLKHDAKRREASQKQRDKLNNMVLESILNNPEYSGNPTAALEAYKNLTDQLDIGLSGKGKPQAQGQPKGKKQRMIDSNTGKTWEQDPETGKWTLAQ